jgi:hypothetical protein
MLPLCTQAPYKYLRIARLKRHRALSRPFPPSTPSQPLPSHTSRTGRTQKVRTAKGGSRAAAKSDIVRLACWRSSLLPSSSRSPPNPTPNHHPPPRHTSTSSILGPPRASTHPPHYPPSSHLSSSHLDSQLPLFVALVARTSPLHSPPPFSTSRRNQQTWKVS